MIDHSTLSNLKFHYQSRLTDQETSLSALRDSVTKSENWLKQLEAVNTFFQQYIQFKTEKTRDFIVSIVNRGLEYIFGSRIRVEITSEVKNNKVVYDVVIHDEEAGIEGGRESHGGGVLCVVAFLFKFVVSYLTKKIRLMVEDESFADVSFHYQERLSMFLKELCREFNYTVLLTSHQERLDLHADTVYELDKVGDETKLVSVHHDVEEDETEI